MLKSQLWALSQRASGDFVVEILFLVGFLVVLFVLVLLQDQVATLRKRVEGLEDLAGDPIHRNGKYPLEKAHFDH
jgi:hypothetical protein